MAPDSGMTEYDGVAEDLAVVCLGQFSKEEEDEIMKLAAVGLSPAQIASALEWNRTKGAAFCALASRPGSKVAMMIESGKTIGMADPQKRLYESAQTGNLDAIKELQKVQFRNRYNQLIRGLDDDEFTD